MIDKVKVFQKELDWIHDENLKAFATYAIEHSSGYVFLCSASTSSKYHARASLGSGGLIRHIKGALLILKELFEADTYTDKEKDLVTIALMLHDFKKESTFENYSNPNAPAAHSTFEHPLVAAQWVVDLAEEYSKDHADVREDALAIANIISCHMGKFNTSKRSSFVLPTPTTRLDFLCHTCDLLSSRRFLNVDYGDDYYRPEDYEIKEDLTTKAEELIQDCKNLISNGVDRNQIYAVIEATSGYRNPRRIEDAATLEKTREEVLKLAV